MDNEYLNELIAKYIEGTATVKEQQQLLDWYNAENDTEVTWLANSALEELQVKQRIFSKIYSRTQASPAKATKLWWPYTTAAAIIFALGAWLLFQNAPSPSLKKTTLAYKNDIKPGGNKAYLTLADGKRIVLTDGVNGKLALQGGIQVEKMKDGQLVYTVAEGKTATGSVPQYNTIETPKGGQYLIKLPDGSKVWLNAASSLRYPVSFARLTERRVELKGEAYFEVAHDQKVPFRVKTEEQEIEVLGTSFNVNSYKDDSYEKTTLLKGSVSVSHGNDHRLLKPGQEATIKEVIKVAQVDVETALAWKNGLFIFNDEPLESILRKVSRWYDVDIVFDNVNKHELYGGSFSRYDHLSSVLRKMELTGEIHFKIEGRRITATK